MSKPVSKASKKTNEDVKLRNALAKKRLDLEDGAASFHNSLETLRNGGEKDDLARITELQISKPLVFNHLITRKSIESVKDSSIELLKNWFRKQSKLIHRIWTVNSDVGFLHYFIELRNDNISDLYEVRSLLDEYMDSDFEKYFKINFHFISAATAGEMGDDLIPVSIED